MNANVTDLDATQRSDRKARLGQGMIEYLLVMTVVISTTVVIMNTISSTTSTLINSMVTNIQSVTNVTNSGN